MKHIFTFLVLLFLIDIAHAQEESLHVKPFQVSFFYPVGTSATYSKDNAYLFSFNILTGVTGATEGFELGGISNVNRHYNHGFQLAGISNVAGSYNSGFQLAGIVNILGSYNAGAQIGGIANVVGGSSTGIQLGGIANVCGGDASGSQTAGIVNIADSLDGVQIAGIANVAGHAKALQLAGIGNVAEDFEGVQVGGIYNQAGTVKGFMLAGIVNVCDSIDGIPLGLINIVRNNGYRRFDVSTSEAFDVQVSFKMGVRAMYTIYSLAYELGDLHNNTGFGLGLGSNMMLGNRSGIDFEAIAYHVNHHLIMTEENFMYTFRMQYVYELANHFALFAGPSINMLQYVPSDDASEIAPSYGVEYHGYNHFKYWLGFNAGVRF